MYVPFVDLTYGDFFQTTFVFGGKHSETVYFDSFTNYTHSHLFNIKTSILNTSIIK